jgi:hypothetical protein
LFYAEGNWDRHLASFAELPDRSIVYHVDQGDVLRAHQTLGDKFCLSGGIPNYLLAFGSAEEVRRHCRQVIDCVARDGGYVMDASAIVQNAKVENIRALTEATLEYGVYSRGHAAAPQPARGPEPLPQDARPDAFVRRNAGLRPPGACTTWDEKRTGLPAMIDDEPLCRRIWESIDTLGNMYVWWIALAF